jgi:hypothetical protein
MTVRYFHTNPTPYALIIITTLMNNQSNVIQYNFYTLSNSDYVVLFCTKIITETSLKHFSRDSHVIGHAHRRDFSFHLSHTKHTHWAKPATSNPIAAARGAITPCFQGSIENTPVGERLCEQSCRFHERIYHALLRAGSSLSSSSEHLKMSKQSPWSNSKHNYL